MIVSCCYDVRAIDSSHLFVSRNSGCRLCVLQAGFAWRGNTALVNESHSCRSMELASHLLLC